MTLGEAGVQLLDCDHRTPPAAADGLPYVAIPQLEDGRINLTQARRISPEHFEEWTRKTRPVQGDIVLSRRCNPGETAAVSAGMTFALGQNLVLLRAKGGIANARFLRWAVRGPEWWEQIDKFINVGAVFESLRCADIPKFQLTFPPQDVQIQIADILDSLDFRIESLRALNATLETLSRAIFKSWFVNFDPVRAKAEGREPEGMDAATAALFPGEFQESTLGPVPKDWRVGKVRDLGAIICGKTPPTAVNEYYGDEVPFITIPDMNGRVFAHQTAKKLSSRGADFQRLKYLPAGAVCVSCIATVGLVSLTSEPSQTNQQINSIIPSAEFPSYFSFFTLRNLGDDIRSAGSGGSVFGNLSKSRFESLDLLLPPSSLAQAYGSFVTPIFDKILTNLRQEVTLTQLRDTLLPRLISGKLRDFEAEKMVEAML